MSDIGADKNAAYITTYSPSFLTHIYDRYVLGFNMSIMWGCPVESILLPFFSENFSRNHLDVGVATGYFPAAALARPFRRDSKQHLTLLDLGPNPLRAASARVLSVATATELRCVEADVTEPPPDELRGSRFDSISMFNLFHCVPGGKAKFRGLATFKGLLSENGVLCGCTVLGNAHAANWFTSKYLWLYNKQLQVFHNYDDRKEDVLEVLEREFEEVETWVIGTMMLFRAKKPKKTPVDVQ
ncbi:methyltransferase domain-containing protein [Sodiomyces alkalinus F11]|uniref:Methyltransferase domain-containing protein n=1 Tax=Sodiomyces alkalinus (strain CBS 110278 / VKM F-3762 / F11) TaxID=1314773 RepID=A0A3N2PL32_SODAK|nr:methyltransferase domain-containing protein [Sodiomyces alkalinus F11]ROT35130.1 methyltransferase domain-containing protein [Sodiomyces alkalinus F11]